MRTGTKTTRLIGVKAGPEDGLDAGQVKALVSVYDVKDSDGEVIPAGEYDEWVDAVKAGRDSMPTLFYAHDHRNPFAVTGDVIDLNPQGERTLSDGSVVKGLEVTAQFDLDQPDNPEAQGFARKAYDNVKRGRIPQWSMAWVAKARERVGDAYHLKGVALSEVSPVLRGANSLTGTLAVKSERDGQKAYLDLDVPGSFEAVQSAIMDALQARYPAGPDSPWTSLVATMTDRACYQVSGGTADDQLYWVDYTIEDDGSATLGEPVETTATLAGAPKAAPTGRDPFHARVELERHAPAVI